MTLAAVTLVSIAALATGSVAQEAKITVQADQPGHEITRYLTGACIEDVNHEIYGGIYSQMIFGEHFQEPAAVYIDGFKQYGGEWRVQDNELIAGPGDGTKLVSD